MDQSTIQSLYNVRTDNYNDFQQEVQTALKQKLAQVEEVKDYVNRIQTQNAKIQKFKEIQNIGKEDYLDLSGTDLSGTD